MFSLAGKTAVVTGASQGIGQAITTALHNAGASLVLVGRNRERLEASISELPRGNAHTPLLVEADLLDSERLTIVADQISSSYPTVDILINCGGTYLRGPWDEATTESLNELLRTNITGPYTLTRLLLPPLVESRGDIVFINSTVTKSSGLMTGQFKASQQGLQAIADSLRAEFNQLGVRVTSIYPGRTATPRQENIYADEGREYHPESLLQPTDVANSVMSCLSLPETAEVTDLYIRPRFKS